MLRTAMKPRFVRLFVVMLVLVAAFIWLGRWQWGVAHSKANDDTLKAASAQARVPLEHLMRPQTQFDNSTSLRPVSVVGRYDAAKTELVAGRVLNKRDGWWVMTPLVVDSTGARLPIVRGFVTKTTGIPTPPTGRVTVEGALAPGESVSTLGELPSGQIGTIDMGSLLNEWGGSVYNAFIFATKQTPATNDAAMQPIPPPVPERSSIEWRNAAYALQWWVFAAFAAIMWFRLVREDMRDEAVEADDLQRHAGDADADARAPEHDAPDTMQIEEAHSETRSPARVRADEPRKDHT